MIFLQNTLALIKLLLDPEYDPEVEKAQIEEEKRQAERDKQEKSEQDESASESSEDSSDSDWAPQTSSSRKRVINRRRRYRPVKRRRYGGGGRRVFQLTRPAMIDSDSESSGEESEEEETKQKTPRKETDIDGKSFFPRGQFWLFEFCHCLRLSVWVSMLVFVHVSVSNLSLSTW